MANLWDRFLDTTTSAIGTGFEWFIGGSAAVGGYPQAAENPQLRQETAAQVGTGIATGAALVDQAVTTGILAADPTDGVGVGQAWGAARYASPGQAIVGAAGGALDNLGFDQFGADNPLSARSQVNQAIEMKRPVGYIDDQGIWRGGFKDNALGNLVSGASDATTDWFLDPTVVAGKGAAAARGAVFTRAIDSAADVTKAVAQIEGKRGGWAGAISATRGMTTAEMLRLDWVREAADPDLLASTLRYVADDADEALDYAAKSEVIRAGLGDRAVLEKLAAEKPAVADAISETRKTILDVKASDIPDADELTRLDAVYQDLVTRDELLARLVTEAREDAPTRALAGTVGRNRTVSRFGRWEKTKAQYASKAANAKRSYLDPDGGYTYETTRQGKGFRPVTVMRWVGDERPSGWLAVSGAPVQDASREVAAFARRARLDDVEWIGRYTAASTDQQRSVIGRQLEEAAWGKVAADAGVDVDFAQDLYRSMNAKRQGVIDAYKARAFGVNDDGSLVVDPMLTSQMADSIPLFDADVLRNVLKLEAGKDSVGTWALTIAEDRAARLQGIVDVYWRPMVLIRGGYAPRNLFEGAGRAAAVLPSMFKDLPAGSVRAGRNVGRRIANRTDDALEGTPEALISRIQKLAVERDELLAKVDAAGKPTQGELGGVATVQDTVAATARLDQLRSEIADLSARLDVRVSVKDQLRPRLMAGDGKLDLGDGVQANDSFAGPAGGPALENLSAGGTTRRSLDPNAVAGEKGLGEWGTVTIKDANYFDAFAQAGRQFANDPVARKVLAGESWRDIHAWLSSGAGRDTRRAYGIGRGDAYQKVGEVGALVERYIPEDLRGLLLADEIPSAQQWAKQLAKREDLPTIHGRRIVETASGPKSFREGWQAFTGKVFEYIGTLPEDRLLRAPFYRTTYRREMLRQRRLWVEQGGEVSNDLVRRWEAAAHKAALQDTKRTLYTIERYSNISYYGRFLAPFLAATNNTVRTWGRIIGRDPSVLARANLAWQAPSEAGLLWDRETNRPVPAGTRIGLDDRYAVLIPLPKSWTDRIGATNPDDPLSRIEFAPPQTSFNVALQSDPVWLPGWGPLATVPTAIAANNWPDSPAVKWLADNAIFPEGVPRETWKSILPAWARQAVNAQDQDGTVYGRVYATTLVREQQRYRNGERSTEPTPEEIEGRADAWFKLRVLGAASLPFAATMRDTNFQFYVDEAARFRREYGLEWFDKFVEQYPDAGEYAFRVSQNESGIRATVGDTANAKRYEGLVADVATDDTGLIGLVTNDGSEYEFDSASYNWQYDRSVAPGSSEKFRGPQSGQEAAEAARVSAGWNEYRKVRTQRDAILAARGLTPAQIDRAPDVKERWDAWMATQRDDPANGNPEWWSAYQQRDGAKYQNTINGMRKILADQSFRSGPVGSGVEFELLEQYLAARDSMLRLLAARGAAGYGSTLAAQSNADIAAVWSQYTAGLTQSNTRFNDIYIRYLDGEFERRAS